jgi:hypothetical protein
MDYQLIDNKTNSQYEFHAGEFIPKIEYIKTGSKIYLTHTEVPVQLQGKGIGNILVSEVLEDIKQTGLSLVPLCPFVAAYIKRHPEWNFLVSKG